MRYNRAGIGREREGGERTEAGVGVLSLDALSPVLAEEHVCRKSTLGSLRVALGLAARLLSGSFLWRGREQGWRS